MEALITLVVWLGLAVGCGVIASSKGRSGFGYFVLGLLLPLIGIIIAIGIAPLSEARPINSFIDCQKCLRPYRGNLQNCPHCGSANASKPAQKKCPACAEMVLAEARKCKHCGEALLA